MATVGVWKNSYKQREYHSFDVKHDFPGVKFPWTVSQIAMFLDDNDVADALTVSGYDHNHGMYSETYYLKAGIWERQPKVRA